MKGILLIGIAMILLIGIASAFEFDNVKDFAKTKDQKYGTITITNAFGLGDKILDITLDDNSDVCFTDCYAEGKTTLEKPSVLFSKLSFRTLSNVKRELQYTIYVDGEKYDGKELEAGTYTWRIEAKKNPFESIDWIATSNGIDLTEWAVWTSGLSLGLRSYWAFDETTGTTAEDSRDRFDLTVTGTNWVAGKIKNAYKPASDFNMTAWNMTGESNFSISFWYNQSTPAIGTEMIIGTTALGIDGDFFVRVAVGYLDVGINDGAATQLQAYNPPSGGWDMLTFAVNSTNLTFYVNGVLNQSLTLTNFVVDRAFNMFNIISGAEPMTRGVLDEFAIWNRTLTQAEITQLYNGGVGISYLANVVLWTPSNHQKVVPNQLIFFNCTTGISNFKNLTLFIDNSFNYSMTEPALNKTYSWSAIAPHNWSCEAYDTSHTNFVSDIRYFNITAWKENSQSYNSSVYETETGTFSVNYSYDNSQYTSISAMLNYNGTSYSGTRTGSGSNAIFSKYLGIPTVDYLVNKNFHWMLSLTNVTGTFQINSSISAQSVSPINLTICKYAGTPNITYINFTFKDETNSTFINASIDTSTWTYYLGDGTYTKTYIFSNLTTNSNYPFCFQPADKTLHKTVNLQFSAIGYPQRRWEDASDLTNTSTNKVLYLLSSTDGIYSTYQVQTSAGQGLQGVTVQVERQFSGVWTIVEQGITGSDGSVTFWLNPNYDHRLTFTKTGYTAAQATIRPTSSIYTIQLSGGSSDVSFNSSVEGMRWIITPSPGRLAKSSIVTFGFNLTASLNNVASCRMRLLDNNSVVLASVSGCTSSGGILSLDLNTSAAPKIYGEYAIDIGGGYFIVDADAYWITNITDYTSDSTIYSALQRIMKLRVFGLEDQRMEYSRIVFFFLGLMIALGILSYTTGWDFATSGGILMFLCIIVWIVSVTGFLNLSGLTFSAVLDKYFGALIMTMITCGYMFNKLRRDSLL